MDGWMDGMDGMYDSLLEKAEEEEEGERRRRTEKSKRVEGK
jgi:hypothetical protein